MVLIYDWKLKHFLLGTKLWMWLGKVFVLMLYAILKKITASCTGLKLIEGMIPHKTLVAISVSETQSLAVAPGSSAPSHCNQWKNLRCHPPPQQFSFDLASMHINLTIFALPNTALVQLSPF
jgi:hypothetical protein